MMLAFMEAQMMLAIMDQEMIYDYSLELLVSPTAKPGVLFDQIFIPFEQKKPYLVIRKWNTAKNMYWRAAREITILEANEMYYPGWKYMTKQYGEMKRQFFEMLTQ